MCSRAAQVNGKFVPQNLRFAGTVPRGESPAENPARFWVDMVVGWRYSFCRSMLGRKGSAMTGRRVPRFRVFFWECAFSQFGVCAAKPRLVSKGRREAANWGPLRVVSLLRQRACHRNQLPPQRKISPLLEFQETVEAYPDGAFVAAQRGNQTLQSDSPNRGFQTISSKERGVWK